MTISKNKRREIIVSFRPALLEGRCFLFMVRETIITLKYDVIIRPGLIVFFFNIAKKHTNKFHVLVVGASQYQVYVKGKKLDNWPTTEEELSYKYIF
ncbi:MAG: hypothetical protein PHY93_18810 [Bacteriovorax sp.]|nr:hypothetical protein [Bacteriovorax sp.]